jgi:phage terminase small subunit
MRVRLGTAYGLGRETLIGSHVRLPQLAVASHESRSIPAALRQRPAYDALRRMKHRQFVDSFLLHGNAARAAREAGYSEKTAARQGWCLRQRPDIDAAIKEWLAQTGSRAERVLDRLEAIALMPLGAIEQADTRRVNVSRLASAEFLKLRGRIAAETEIDDAPSEMTVLDAARRIAHVLAEGGRIAKEQEQKQHEDQEQD